ncbi:dnaJ homolog subfamily C member 24 isoform X2 [Labrus bergylta]|uniref:dnaJ homolog subfamily C member 24 isoform X2 n=1 Tax=Labrus bergylta TaxID=56723 RepID=UPI0010FBB635|nr:dnaJ homolog subfamily C member 24 isoform X2 [Labrus bergylta]
MCEAAEKDLYAVLGASPSDSLKELRHRYQQLALQYHPDRLGDASSSEADSAVKKFLEVDAAWRILSDQNSRRQYDLQRRGAETGLASGFYGLSGGHDLGPGSVCIHIQLSLWRKVRCLRRGGRGGDAESAAGWRRGRGAQRSGRLL